MKPIDRLLDIMAALRDRDSGCPWDIDQDFKTISAYTIEEAYEVADAIERNDLRDLKDELGDLLFQVVFHSQMAKEQGVFDFDDVVAAICDKLVRRHPHVFGESDLRDKHELNRAWEQHKRDERAVKKERRECESHHSALDGIASALPALRWSQKLQQRAAGVGFDWPDIKPVFEKLNEELAELKTEIAQQAHQESIADELGDVLFVCVNLAMHLDVNAEQVLRHANLKFISRFMTMEALMQIDGTSFKAQTLAQMESYWQRAKERLKAESEEA